MIRNVARKAHINIWIQLNPGCTALTEPPTWIDHLGHERKTVRDRSDIHPRRFESHRALVVTIFVRDKHTCVGCGLTFPRSGDPIAPLIRTAERLVSLEVDHIISLRNGGTSHPSNLQALCNRCNSRKSALFDSRYHLIFQSHEVT